MPKLVVNVETEYLSSQINNMDVFIEQQSDVGVSQYRILTDFPDHLNLRDGVVLSTFSIAPNEDVILIVRAFLNEPPFVVFQHSIVFVEEENLKVFHRLNIE